MWIMTADEVFVHDTFLNQVLIERKGGFAYVLCVCSVDGSNQTNLFNGVLIAARGRSM